MRNIVRNVTVQWRETPFQVELQTVQTVMRKARVVQITIRIRTKPPLFSTLIVFS
ncbi:hypothetical protein C1H46_013713 [Malus baccata]|uniref:Uncharacterized protein n=1 Tax=Malus baccata TaxID=106549 RepID=A0A540MPE9_MALBA|nr:hypothetical protein C1H46_013713 [Malus baccata]